MDPQVEIRSSEKTTTIPQLEQKSEQKSSEVFNRVISQRTREWLIKAVQLLQIGKGRNALQDLSQPPSTIPLETTKKIEQPNLSTTYSKQAEVITQEHPAKYSEERRALGLREERTLQEIAQEKDKQRKEAVESYLLYRRREKR